MVAKAKCEGQVAVPMPFMTSGTESCSVISEWALEAQDLFSKLCCLLVGFFAACESNFNNHCGVFSPQS